MLFDLDEAPFKEIRASLMKFFSKNPDLFISYGHVKINIFKLPTCPFFLVLVPGLRFGWYQLSKGFWYRVFDPLMIRQSVKQ
jgi:hypothetical protein